MIIWSSHQAGEALYNIERQARRSMVLVLVPMGDVTARGLFAASAHARGKGCGTRPVKDDKAKNDVHRNKAAKNETR